MLRIVNSVFDVLSMHEAVAGQYAGISLVHRGAWFLTKFICGTTMKTSVIIPVYNNLEAINNLVETLRPSGSPCYLVDNWGSSA